jgi:hypothetical protein
LPRRELPMWSASAKRCTSISASNNGLSARATLQGPGQRILTGFRIEVSQDAEFDVDVAAPECVGVLEGLRTKITSTPGACCRVGAAAAWPGSTRTGRPPGW